MRKDIWKFPGGVRRNKWNFNHVVTEQVRHVGEFDLEAYPLVRARSRGIPSRVSRAKS